MMVAVFAVTGLLAAPAVSEEKAAVLDDKTCTIRITGTYENKQIDVYVTVEAENCAEAAGSLLRAYAKK